MGLLISRKRMTRRPYFINERAYKPSFYRLLKAEAQTSIKFITHFKTHRPIKVVG